MMVILSVVTKEISSVNLVGYIIEIRNHTICYDNITTLFELIQIG